MGYSNQLPWLVNLEIHATMASITSPEVHQLVQTSDLEALGQDEADFGPLVLDTLGIMEWLNIFHTFEKGGTLKALSLLRQYIGMLASFETHDRQEFYNATIIAQKIVRGLTSELANDLH